MNLNLNLRLPKFLQKALENNYKFSVIPAARRTGKTFNVATWLIIKMLEKPSTGLWVDTTQSNIDAYVERYFKVILKPIWSHCSYNQQKKVLIFPNGSYIDFGSAERPENLEGFQYNYGVLNEAGIILRKQNLWQNTLLPMFKGDDTRVKVIGTPKGKNTFYQLYHTTEPNYGKFKFTAHDSPFWSEEEINSYRRSMTETAFRQEMMAEFLEDAGAVFRGTRKVIHNDSYERARGKTEYVMSADLAKHEDFTVIMVAERSTKRVVYIDRFQDINWPLQKGRIIAIWERFNRPKAIIDSTGVGDVIFDDLKQAGMNVEGFNFTNATKAALINDLVLAIENQEIFYPENSVLLDELELYEYNKTRSGNMTYNAPDGAHDDAVISLALVNKLLREFQPVNLTFIDF